MKNLIVNEELHFFVAVCRSLYMSPSVIDCLLQIIKGI